MSNLPFAEAVIDCLREYCNRHYNGNARKLSEFVGINPDTGMVARWLRGNSSGPTLGSIGPVMDKLGVTVEPPQPATRTIWVHGNKYTLPQIDRRISRLPELLAKHGNEMSLETWNAVGEIIGILNGLSFRLTELDLKLKEK